MGKKKSVNVEDTLEVEEDKPGQMKQKEKDKFLETARKRLKRGIDADSHIVEKGIKNLKFVYVKGEQWDQDAKDDRKNDKRLCLEVNLLQQYIDQLVGDERQSRPWIKVRRKDKTGTPQAAEVRQGYINDVLYRSRAAAIFDYAIEMMGAGNRGAWRLCTRYTEENPFEQEVYLERFPNPYVVVMDCDCKSEVKADALWGFVIDKMTKSAYEEKYGEKFVEMATELQHNAKGIGMEHWWDKDLVTVAEYFFIEHEEVTFCQMDNGDILKEDDANTKIANFQRAHKEDPAIQVPTINKKRKIKIPHVKQAIINGLEILEEPKTFPGKYIPLFIANAKDINIDGKTYLRSLIDNAIDSQQLYNFWVTLLAEMIQIQPKAPIMATPKQVKNFEDMYGNANNKAYSVMYYNVDPASPQSKPSRMETGQINNALFTEIARVESNIRSTVGMKNLGEVSKVYSGAALDNMARPGDIVSYGFIDNLSRVILYTAEVINCMIPDILDTSRDIRVRNFDDSERFEPINTTIGQAMMQMKEEPDKYGVDLAKKKQIRDLMKKQGPDAEYNAITKGTYEVVMSVGPQYATQRQESANKLFELARHWPEIMKIAGDLIMSDQDIIGSDEIANRLRRTMPAWLVPPKEGDPPRQQPPNPQMMLMQAKIIHEKVKTMHDKVKLDNELKGQKSDTKEEMLKLLAQLFNPEHPADNLPMVVPQQ